MCAVCCLVLDSVLVPLLPRGPPPGGWAGGWSFQSWPLGRVFSTGSRHCDRLWLQTRPRWRVHLRLAPGPPMAAGSCLCWSHREPGEQASRQNPPRQMLTTDNNESPAPSPSPELEPLHGLHHSRGPSQPRAHQDGRVPPAGPSRSRWHFTYELET